MDLVLMSFVIAVFCAFFGEDPLNPADNKSGKASQLWLCFLYEVQNKFLR